MSGQNGTKPSRRAFAKRRDVLLIGALLCVAVVLWLLFSARGTGAVAVVTIVQNGRETTRQISLAKDGIHEISAGLPVQLEVLDGRIRFVHSVCPDHDCEGFGWLSQDGDWAACLPAGVAVKVENPNEEGPDA